MPRPSFSPACRLTLRPRRAAWLFVAGAALTALAPHTVHAQEPATPAAEAPVQLSQKQLYQKTLQGTAWVVLTDGEGNVQGSGSGWLLDRDEKLLVTNHHVVEGRETVKVFFPAMNNGRPNTEKSYYLKNVQPITGEVFITDPKRDLAVVRLERVPDEVQALNLAADSPAVGEMLHSIGSPGSSPALWVYTTGVVRQVYKTAFRFSGGQAVDANVIETQSPTNPGDSGGPVVDDRGDLVAVVSSATQGARLMTQFIDIHEVQTFVEESRQLLNPQTADDYNRRGLRFRQSQRYDKAISDFNEATKLDPKFALAFSNRGWSFKEKGDLDTAFGDFNEAITLNPKCGEAYKGRSQVSADRGQFDQAIDDSTSAIRIDSDDAAAYSGRGWAYFKKSEFDRAVADYDRALNINPKDAICWNNRGDAHWFKGDFDSAGQDYIKAIEADSDYAVAYVNLGFVWLYKKQDTERGLNAFNVAVEKAPNSPFVYYERGRAYHSLKEHERAINDQTAAIRLNTSYADAYKQRGNVYYDLSKNQEAIADYSEAIRLNPNDAQTYNQRGNALYAMSSFEASIRDYDEAIRLNPNDALPYNNRGNAYSQLGNQEAARADYDRAIQIDPRSGDQQQKLRFTRYLKVVNSTNEPIEVCVVYMTKTVNGDWAWYPAAVNSGKFISFTFQPGETSYLLDRGVKLHAGAIRIWARGLNTGATWDRDRNQDQVIAPQEGYRATAAETYTYTFQFQQ